MYLIRLGFQDDEKVCFLEYITQFSLHNRMTAVVENSMPLTEAAHFRVLSDFAVTGQRVTPTKGLFFKINTKSRASP